MLRDIREDDRFFGGVTVVFGGDYQQLLPVVVHGDRESVVDACLQNSPLWRQISIVRLRENIRVRNHPDAAQFASWLIDIGHGRCQPNSQSDTLDVPLHMLCKSETNLIDAIYSGIQSSPPPPPNFFLSRTILAPKNADVEMLNNAVLDRMQATEYTFLSADSCERELGVDGNNIDSLNLSSEFLRSQNCSSLPLAELRVKIGCPLILLRNLAPAHGLCNGSRMTLIQKSERVLQVILIGGDHDGEIALIPRISLTPSINTSSFAFKLRRRQYPLHLAFAMSVHRSQGQTVEHVGLDLRTAVFSHGQLYVALSRTTSPENVTILLPDHNETTPTSTINVVYPEVLLD
jgi:ATP-dependent DNA helicase PIF1